VATRDQPDEAAHADEDDTSDEAVLPPAAETGPDAGAEPVVGPRTEAEAEAQAEPELHGRHAGSHLDDEEPSEATAPPARHGPKRAGLDGWAGLRALARPRLNVSQLIVAVLCAALGFALIVQVRQNQSDNLSSLQQSDLVRLLDDVTQRNQSLEREYSSLESTREQLEAGSGSRQAAITLATQRAETQGILSGRLAAQGPGITLKIAQGTQPIPAATMFDVLEELRNAGAEAVQVNGVRLVASSYFELQGDTLVTDGVAISSPYTWVAIGDPQTLAPALGIPGGALAAVRNTGSTADLTQAKLVKVTATRAPTTPTYATPAPLPTGS
jgi:uncharacterized protein YlxW (UPF0749 family)